MPIWRITYIFTQQNQGWTESLYNNNVTLASVRNQALALLPLRMGCLGNLAQCVGIRFTDILTFRGGQLYTDASFPRTGTLGGGATVRNQSRVSLGLPFSSVLGPRRIYWMHGIPDAWTNGNLWAPTLAGSDAVDAFVQYVNNVSNGMSTLIRTYQTARVNSLASITASGLTQTLNPLPVLNNALTTRVVYRALRGVDPQPNRVFVPDTLNVAVNQFIVRGWFPRPAIPSPGRGNCAVFDYGLSSINAVGPYVLRTRKTGRPFGLLRGRSSPDR